MPITVHKIRDEFPSFKKDDLIKLIGHKNFDDKDVISLSKIASYKGKMSEELSIFTAKSEGKSFIKMVDSGQKRNKLAQSAGVVLDAEDKQTNINGSNISGSISKDTSIFDIAKKKKEPAMLQTA